ncbi:MAG TPA: phosphoribosylglycinamide formyltransferase [Chloroflexota bacterium]|nr:phosphoribosylglycinamide formyltransferase [Chloroflexota bacterium]
MSKPNIVVFISGSGSNLQAIIDAVQAGELDVEIVLVVSNRKGAYGLVRAAENGIPTVYHPLKPYRDAGKSRAEYEADLAEKLRPLNPDLIVLAGWMHVLGPGFLNQFPNCVINLHPALPGQFAGTQAIERAYEAYQRGEISHSGCMVHLTIPEVDAGPVITQANVPIYPEDTLAQFEARMHQAEHHIMVEAIRLFGARQGAAGFSWPE